MSEENKPAQTYTCPDCQAGVLHLRYMSYFTQVQGELITVPNFPAWVCDMCGYREDDARARNWLNVLLSQHSGRKRARRPGRPLDRRRGDQAHT